MYRLTLVLLLLLFTACSDDGGSSPTVDGEPDAGETDVGDDACVGDACACETPLVTCGERCVDTRNNSLHCGACDNVCGQGIACVAGECVCDDCCEDGETACGDTCVNTDDDPAHCGDCDNVCDGECEAGVCMVEGCDGQVCDGECVDVSESDEHCGGCRNACPGESSCENGACVCPEGEALCRDGCAILANDNEHCGECGNACAPDGEVCEDSACVETVSPDAPNGHLGTLFWTAELDNRNVHLNDPDILGAPFGIVVVNMGDEDARITLTDPDGDAEGASTEVIVYGARDDFEARVYTELIGPGGRIGDPLSGTLRDIPVPPGTMLQMPLPRYQLPDNANTFETIGWRLESDRPVAAWMFNPMCCDASGTAGASLLIPAEAAGTEYLVASPEHTNQYPATLSIMAASERVNATVQLTDDRLWGGVLVPEPDGEGVIRTPLAPGQVLNLETMLRDAPPNPDLSGSTINADGPVIAFAGHACARIGGGACDHVEEQLVPREILGSAYVVPVPAGRSWVQLVAAEDVVVTASDAVATLAEASGWSCEAFLNDREITLPAGATCMFPTERPLGLTGSADFLVATYSGQNKGMHLQIPVSHWRERYIVPVPRPLRGSVALIAAPDGSAITIGGERIELDGPQQAGGQTYRTAAVPLGTGPHEIVGDAPFGLAVFGSDTKIGWSMPGGFASEAR